MPRIYIFVPPSQVEQQWGRSLWQILGGPAPTRNRTETWADSLQRTLPSPVVVMTFSDRDEERPGREEKRPGRDEKRPGRDGRGAAVESAMKREAARKKEAVRVAQLQKQILNQQLLREESTSGYGFSSKFVFLRAFKQCFDADPDPTFRSIFHMLENHN